MTERTYTHTEMLAIKAAALREAAGKIRSQLYLLSIGTPGEGPFTRQDRTRDEVIDQAENAVLALIDQPAEDALNAMIGAAYEAAAVRFDEKASAAHARHDRVYLHHRLRDAATIRSLTPADAIAALEQVKLDAIHKGMDQIRPELEAEVRFRERERCAEMADAEYRERIDRQMKAGPMSGAGLMHGQVSEAMRKLAAKMRGESK